MFRLPDLNQTESSTSTMYMRIYERIRDAITSGEMLSDEKLPSKRNLAEQLGVSVKTIENAYEQLLLEGYIYSREKSGYFVEPVIQFRSPGHKTLIEYDTRFKETEYKVNLRANRNAPEDFPTDTWCRLIRESLTEERDRLFKTVPFNGLFELRKAIAAHLIQARGMNVSPDQIIIGAGTEYMYNRLSQIFGPDTVYALTAPCSRRLHTLYENNHLTYHTILATRAGLDMKYLRESGSNVLHISPAHQYPMGKVLPIQDRIELLHWADSAPDHYIIEDDFDSEYVVTGHPVRPLYAIDVNDKVIYMNTFSKSVSAAVRISYMVLPEPLMQRYLDTISFYTCPVASLEQYALAKFITGGHLERYIRRINRKNYHTRQILIRHLESLLHDLPEGSHLGIEKDCAGSTLLIWTRTPLSDLEIKNHFRRNGILVSMMSDYYKNLYYKTIYTGVLIINYSGLTEEMITYFCKSLKEMYHIAIMK